LPSDVATAAGALGATLWRLASEAASSSLDVFRQDAQREIDIAQEQAIVMVAERDHVVAAAEETSRGAAELRLENAKLLTRLVELETAKTMLEDQLAQSRSGSVAASKALSDARRDFAEELGKLRDMQNQSEQRLAATEKRALLEIDSERTVARRTRQELRVAIDRMADAQAAHQAERDQLRDALTTTKTQLAASMTRCASVEEEVASKSSALDEQIEAAEVLRDRMAALSNEMQKGGRPSASAPPPRPEPIARKIRVRRNLKFTDFSRLKTAVGYRQGGSELE